MENNMEQVKNIEFYLLQIMVITFLKSKENNIELITKLKKLANPDQTTI